MKRQVFIVWFIIFLAWSIYRVNFYFPEWLDEFIIKPLIFVLPVLFMVLVREKKKIKDLGLDFKPKSFTTDLYIGVVIAVLFALEGLLANFIKHGQYSFSPILSAKIPQGIGFFLLINLVTSVSEEILGRGYLYQRLFKVSNNQFWAAFTSSYLFMLLHIPIIFTRLQLMGSALIIYPLSIMILGLANSYVFTMRGSLILPILIHTFWNMTVALFL